jgi:hypothetical protein
MQSIHEECLDVVYGCEKYRSSLEHKEFCLHTDNQALAWLLRQRWVLRLAPFKFKVLLDNIVTCIAR